MAFTFATLAAVVLLFSAASCAPAGTQDACEGVRKSSQELNRIAKNVAVQVSPFLFIHIYIYKLISMHAKYTQQHFHTDFFTIYILTTSYTVY